MSRSVSDDDVEAYRRDGAVCQRWAPPARWVEILDRGIERNIVPALSA